MMRSTSPPTSTHRTKTGRVSKAAKGMPVHHCECGKTYTRAEHLRRHQQNHKPGAFPCNIPDCNRAFAREDLLIRHQAKHNDPLGPPSNWASSTAQFAPQLSDTLASSVASISPALQETLPFSRLQAGSSLSYDSSTGKVSASITELQSPDLIVSNEETYPGMHQMFDRDVDPLPSHDFGNGFQYTQPVAPVLDQIPLPLNNTNAWMAGAQDFDPSHSPAFVDPLAPVPPRKGPSPAHIQLHTPASEDWMCDTGFHSDLTRNTSFGDITETGHIMPPECRDILEQDELVTPTSVPKDFGARRYHHRTDNEQRYLDAYWRWVHPVWPIVHKPTFDMAYTSPLLRAAMLTLGACSIGNQIDSANGCIMHKRCLKVIKKRTINSWHSYRLCDMQAILLVELFSVYKSRRPSLQLSKPFQDNYCALSRNYDIDTTNPLFSSYELSSVSHLPQDFSTITYERECEQRLLAAYYVLDQEQAALFGRRNTDVPDFSPGNLNLPQPVHIWDTSLTDTNPVYSSQTRHYGHQQTLSQAVATSLSTGASSVEPYDLFTRILTITYFNDGRRDSSFALPDHVPDLDHHVALLNRPHIELAHQTLALCKITPIRALLATAGESWVMAEKLNLHADYKAAQETVRQWVSTSATGSFHHAVEIIRMHRLNPRTTCSYHDWSLHLATIVVWAYAYTRKSPRKSLQLSIPSSTSVEPLVAGSELDEAVAKLALVGIDDNISWEDVKRIISWAKARMEKYGDGKFCGVVSGALDVLNALLIRGDEDGWF
ncbi:hypothetical protein E2P81_ATG10354 [Venturia nashicola]|nr:hypothetical protein E2P81_ATG10354 [Venturia nashicola]